MKELVAYRPSAGGRTVVQLLGLSWMLLGLALAVVVRVWIAGPEGGPHSISGALVFAAILAAFAVLGRAELTFGRRALASGVVGAVVLVLPAVVMADGGPRPHGSYVTWGLAVCLVATSEEAFLRGALFDAVTRWRGPDVAVLISTSAFALLHLPLYGVGSLPLDFAVGLWLGAVRIYAGSWTAPAVAHVTADLIGWWLV